MASTRLPETARGKNYCIHYGSWRERQRSGVLSIDAAALIFESGETGYLAVQSPGAQISMANIPRRKKLIHLYSLPID